MNSAGENLLGDRIKPSLEEHQALAIHRHDIRPSLRNPAVPPSVDQDIGE
jgi:hypothetical protein